jgi:general bacterial porin, GBP family
MRKRVFALLAGLTGGLATAAEPQMVLYGIIDTGIAYTHVSQSAQAGQPAVSSSQFGMTTGGQSGSRWGFKGWDDLGDGWRASFVLEGGVSSLTGQPEQGGRMFGRQATIGVSNNAFGSLVAGRQQTITTIYTDVLDPLQQSWGQSNMGASFSSANTIRYDSLIQYTTPTWHGLQAGLGYSFNTGMSALYQTNDGSVMAPSSNYFESGANMRALSAAAMWVSGNLRLIATYDRLFAGNTLPSSSGAGVVSNTTSAAPTEWIVGATYNLGLIELAGAYGKTYNGSFSGQQPGNGIQSPLLTTTLGQSTRFTDGFDSQSALFGFTLPLGEQGHQLLASWQMQQPQGRLSSDPLFATQNIFSVAYTRPISKRTDYYVWASYGDNFQMIKSAKSSVVGAGLRHLF